MLVLCPLPLTEPDDVQRRWLWVRSRDGQQVDTHGEDPSAALPRDSDCVLLLPPQQVRWHHLTLPPHPVAKRAAVLSGILDTCVLGEPEQLHAALPPDFKATEANWLAVTERDILRQLLDELSQIGLRPHRIVPMIAPSDAPQALAWPQGDGWRVALSGPNGVAHIGPMQALDHLSDLGSDAPAAAMQMRCPSNLAAAVESAWPQQRIQVLGVQALLLQCAASSWNLAQFEFRVSAAQRRTQGLQNAWRQLRHGPAWRPVRAGLIVALLAALVLPPSWAWREHQVQLALGVQARTLVQETFPDIQLVIDPALQMQRAVDALAAKHGGQADNNLTGLLQLLSQLPKAHVLELNWQAQQADVRIHGVDTATVQALLSAHGWRVQAQGPDRWRLSRGSRS